MHTDDRTQDDPFAALVLDAEFIAAAPPKEAAVAVRGPRSGRRIPLPPAPRRSRLDRFRTRLLTQGRGFSQVHSRLICGAIIATVGVLVVAPRLTEPQGQPRFGSGIALLGGDDTPTPRRSKSRSPLGTPPPVLPDAGPHQFLAVQSDASSPVTYDPCRPLSYVVNARTAPPGGDALLFDAVETISQSTGLRFQYEGPTDEPATQERLAFQRARYGDRWAPILIAWSDPGEMPALHGDVTGNGGSTRVHLPFGGPTVYVSGRISLDGPQLGEMLARKGDVPVRGTILHELGHLVGLDHVDDPAQLMYRTSHYGEFQRGDMAGLARLGAGSCVRFL